MKVKETSVVFNICEGKYVDFDAIHDSFVDDYLFSSELSNREIQCKYGMTNNEFRNFAREIREEFGVNRRPVERNGKYCYLLNGRWIIQKRINGEHIYFGRVPSESIALKLVELCKKLSWDIDKCTDIVHNWSRYV